jgi:alanine racemase
MNRLGIHPAFAKSIIKSCSKFQTQNYPQGIFSHLAASEAPDSKLTLSQIQSFQALKKELGAFFTTSKFHLANSGGIWNAKNLSLQNGMTDVIRPGLSLYGIPPGPEAPHRSLASVMTFRARVIAIHRLKQGDSIGYLGTYRVSSPQAVYAAILPVGYADGVVRALSNTGHAWVNEKPTRFLGNVSMDLCAVQCFEGTQVGDLVELIGPHVDAWAQAKAAGTIPYELFTSLSPRVRRTYS